MFFFFLSGAPFRTYGKCVVSNGADFLEKTEKSTPNVLSRVRGGNGFVLVREKKTKDVTWSLSGGN